MASVILPLSLDTHRNFQAFFHAIEDKSIQSALLKDKSVDASVRDVIALARDKKFLKMAERLVNEMISFRSARVEWKGTFAAHEAGLAKSSADQMTVGAQAIRDYIQTKYPEGVKLLTEYGKLAQPAHLMLDDTVSAWTNVAAYAEVLVNGAVYVNVAIATNAVVAAAAAAVVAVAVMVP